MTRKNRSSNPKSLGTSARRLSIITDHGMAETTEP